MKPVSHNVCRESSTEAVANGADGRKIGDVLLTNMTVLQVRYRSIPVYVHCDSYKCLQCFDAVTVSYTHLTLPTNREV